MKTPEEVIHQREFRNKVVNVLKTNQQLEGLEYDGNVKLDLALMGATLLPAGGMLIPEAIWFGPIKSKGGAFSDSWVIPQD